jgi:deoxycytidine triphosphate deaminase
MAILPYQEIQERIKADNIITNAHIGECLGPASYELRVGSIRSIEGGAATVLKPDEQFVIKPGASVLIGTLEEVHLPGDIGGLLFLKSSLGRAGYIPWSQGYVDPGYNGSLTIALHNFAGAIKIFSGGQRICHLVLLQLKAPTTKPYTGPYTGSIGATGTKEQGPIVIGASSGLQIVTSTREAIYLN